MKLGDFLEGKPIGFKFKESDWTVGPYTLLGKGKDLAFVLNGVGCEVTIFMTYDTDWYPYVEPKKKVKYYKALLVYDGYFCESGKYFKNEKEASHVCGPVYVRLLTEQPIEIEEK